jgi:hypothetical protein
MKTSSDSPRPASANAPKPGTAEFTAQRQQLAQLIGRLIARRWLRQRPRSNGTNAPSRREAKDHD